MWCQHWTSNIIIVRGKRKSIKSELTVFFSRLCEKSQGTANKTIIHKYELYNHIYIIYILHVPYYVYSYVHMNNHKYSQQKKTIIQIIFVK